VQQQSCGAGALARVPSPVISSLPAVLAATCHPERSENFTKWTSREAVRCTRSAASSHCHPERSKNFTKWTSRGAVRCTRSAASSHCHPERSENFTKWTSRGVEVEAFARRPSRAPKSRAKPREHGPLRSHRAPAVFASTRCTLDSFSQSVSWRTQPLGSERQMRTQGELHTAQSELQANTKRNSFSCVLHKQVHPSTTCSQKNCRASLAQLARSRNIRVRTFAH